MVKQPKKFDSVDQTDWDNEIIKPITLKIPKGSWIFFKDLIPRTKTLNEALVDLIHKYIVDNTESDENFDANRFLKEQEWYGKERKKKKMKR